MVRSSWKQFKVARSISASLKIEGFSYAGTAERDYGQGIIRVSSTFIKNHCPAMLNWPRHQLMRVKNLDTKCKTYAILRVLDTEEEFLACMEYDDRRKLGIEAKGRIYKFELEKASGLRAFSFYWNHPSNMVRIDFKLSVYLTAISIILGVLISLLIPT